MWNYMLLFHIGRPSLPVSGTVMGNRGGELGDWHRIPSPPSQPTLLCDRHATIRVALVISAPSLRGCTLVLCETMTEHLRTHFSRFEKNHLSVGRGCPPVDPSLAIGDQCLCDGEGEMRERMASMVCSCGCAVRQQSHSSRWL
jgi:hypothetical protein